MDLFGHGGPPISDVTEKSGVNGFDKGTGLQTQIVPKPYASRLNCFLVWTSFLSGTKVRSSTVRRHACGDSSAVASILISKGSLEPTNSNPVPNRPWPKASQ